MTKIFLLIFFFAILELVKVFIIVADLSKKSGTSKLIQRLQKNTELQSIDVLVNSAANFTVKKIENISIKDLDSDFQLNVISTFIISKYIYFLAISNDGKEYFIKSRGLAESSRREFKVIEEKN